MTEVDALGAWVPTETDDIKDSELWSLDATLTDFILPRIKAFRKMERHGYPVLGKDVVNHEDTGTSEDDRYEADWENILFDIEKGFEAHKLLADANFSTAEEFLAHEEIMQKGMQLFADHYSYLWD